MEFPTEADFVSQHQKLLFGEQNADSFEVASLRRKRLAQTFAASVPLSNNITTCNLYEMNLRSYSEIVDDKNDVNNYAEAIQTLLAFSQVECKQWKSSIGKNFNVEIDHCGSHDVNEKDIKFLVQVHEDRGSEKQENSVTSPAVSSHLNCESKQVSSKIFKGTSLPNEREYNFSKKFIAKPTENTRSNFLPTGKSDDSALSSCNVGIIKHSSDAHGRHPPWNSNIYGSALRPSTANISHCTIPRSAPQQPSCTSTSYSNPVDEEKKTQNSSKAFVFSTARDELVVQNQKKWGSRNLNSGCEYGAQKKSLGSTRRSVMNKFIPPVKNSEEESGGMVSRQETIRGNDEIEDERLKNIDPKMVELIQNEIMDCGTPVHWDDIAGLQFAKTTIQEIVVWPMLRPEIFTGLRRPPKGILLFGPPGTGKTLIGKCIASQSLSTFFSISASSLTSKWIGDGEKMVRALFAVARCHQPAVVFIDEIDSLLSQRSDTEHESSRRIKTEFLVQLDGATTGEEDRILVVGATNRPQELDEAARRRLVKRLYIPLPDHEARCQIIQRLMSKEHNCLTEEQINEIGSLTQGYSGADVKNLCQEASLGPIRSISFMDIQSISPEQVRPIAFEDFECAVKRVRASVSSCDLEIYLQWDKTYGSG